MKDEIQELAGVGRDAIESSLKFLAVIKEIQEKCQLTIDIGSHDDSAVDLATMINHTINTQLGGGS